MTDEDFGALTIMIIDDEVFSRKFVTRILEAIGVSQILTAEDGADALMQLDATEDDIDLIICDVEMPEMTGYEFARRVRYGTVSRFKDVPILILTGQPSEDNVQKARTHKVNGFITKPPSIDLLRVQIRHVIGL